VVEADCALRFDSTALSGCFGVSIEQRIDAMFFRMPHEKNSKGSE
jgi:hypothetical protein